MYPLKDGSLWPRDQWYIAGWADEFGEAPIERTVPRQHQWHRFEVVI